MSVMLKMLWRDEEMWSEVFTVNEESEFERVYNCLFILGSSIAFLHSDARESEML